MHLFIKRESLHNDISSIHTVNNIDVINKSVIAGLTYSDLYGHFYDHLYL